MKARDKYWAISIFIAFLIFVFITCFLSSCITQQKCNERFPPQTLKESSDTNKTSEIEYKYRDTVIYQKGKEIKIIDHAYCDSLNRAQMKKTTVKDGDLSASIEIKDGVVNLDCKEDSLKKIILKLTDMIQKEKTTIKSSKESTKVIIKKEIPGWAKYIVFPCLLALILLASGLALFFYVKSVF